MKSGITNRLVSRRFVIYQIEVNTERISHRLDGPAFESKNKEEWWVNGDKHREDGPAVRTVSKSGKVSEVWYVDGKRHREDGPAEVITSPPKNGKSKVRKIYWWKGMKVSYKNYLAEKSKVT